jgi:hypothetical protein
LDAGRQAIEVGGVTPSEREGKGGRFRHIFAYSVRPEDGGCQ